LTDAYTTNIRIKSPRSAIAEQPMVNVRMCPQPCLGDENAEVNLMPLHGFK